MSNFQQDYEEYEEETDEFQAALREKDQIIAKKDELIQMMQSQFVAALDSLRKELNDYMLESNTIQQEMLDRIQELKEQLNKAQQSPASRPSTTSKIGRDIPRQAVQSSLTSSKKVPRKLAQNRQSRPFY